MENEWEEESLVFVEFSGVPLGQVIPPGTQNHQAELLGLASDRPVMHLNGQDFVGHYEDSFGTFLFLDRKDASGGDTKKSGSKDVSVEYFCKTDKKLVMNPAFLVEKAAAEAEPVSQMSTETQNSSQAVIAESTEQDPMTSDPTEKAPMTDDQAPNNQDQQSLQIDTT